MTSLCLILAFQTGIAPKPEHNQVMLKCQMVAFDRVVDWSKLPGTAQVVKDVQPGMPFQARVAKMNGKAFASMIYELAGEAPAFKILSSPNMKTLMGMPANVSIGDAKTGEGFSLSVNLVANPGESLEYQLRVQYDNAHHSPENKTYPFSFSTKLVPNQTLALAIKPTDKGDLTKTVQLITIQWVRDGQASGGR